MDKQQAQKDIGKVFQNKFNLDTFGVFISNLLNNFDKSKERGWAGKQYIYKDFKDHIHNYKRLGLYTDPNGEELEILIINTESLSKLDRARTSLRNFVVKWLQDENNKSHARDYALAAFYSKEDNGADWRFSFIKIEHEAYKDETGKVKTRTGLTPARRYSYLVGEHENSYTAQKQLLPLLEADYINPTIAEIENAFSIEKVTDEFFQQYKELYLRLSEHFNNDKRIKSVIEQEGLNVPRFTKKLLGQIVFLYFLQKKGWMGVPKDKNWEEGQRKFLRELFDTAVEKGENFYRHYLQYLFYEALAKERKGSTEPNYYPRFHCKIPFLNGGLFEADYDWQNKPISIPDQLFHNMEKNKAGDIGTGILDMFDRYNFTIKEDEPLEKEVAVDPEMLGKVFENMLEITERKSTGAYYTPREIVHYMCRESLIHYLDNAINSETEICTREAIEKFIREGLLMLENDNRVLALGGKETDRYKYRIPQCIRRHAVLVDEKLESIKICDPAIGSGAFPVSLLHEIVNARILLQRHFTSSRPKKSPYELKRHAIQESIYGVDIDASAIDIARLRLWLSLIVDEDNYETIEALPNLDYKIVRGNSLVGMRGDTFRDIKVKAEIEKLKEQYITETDEDKKKSLRKQVNIKMRQLLDSAEEFAGYKIDFDFKLFFSEVWRKHKKDGFDVVIGNPPYVQIQKFSGKQEQKIWEKQNYETFAKTGDIYCLFYERGFRILRDGGALTFITSNKWMRANYGKATRKYFLDKVSINQLIDFGDSPIFSAATTYTNIITFSKNRSDIQPTVWDVSKLYKKNMPLETMLSENNTGIGIFSEDAFIIVPRYQAIIKNRIEEIGIPLKEWDVSIYRGILTGLNDAFKIDGKKKAELIAKDPKSAEIIKPVLRGRDIKRYEVNYVDQWLIDIHNGYKGTLPINIENYPVIKVYLDQYWEALKKRQDKGVTPYNLRNCAYHQEFEKDKIVYAEIVFDSAFYYDNEKYYTDDTAFILTGENIKFLTALLNSKLLTYAFKAFYAGGDLRGNTFRYKKIFIEKLPIPKISKEYQKPFEYLVDYVMLAKTKGLKLQAAFFEQLIDGMTFELYFTKEIKTVGKEILKHLEDLKPIKDHMTEEEKLAVIQSEFDRLYDPYHPVRNHLETLDSIEEIRIVKEALK
jgi:hypothetical protein